MQYTHVYQCPHCRKGAFLYSDPSPFVITNADLAYYPKSRRVPVPGEYITCDTCSQVLNSLDIRNLYKLGIPVVIE